MTFVASQLSEGERSLAGTCRICGNTRENQQFLVREMQFGTRQAFPYFECSLCGCLQIVSIPENLPDFYPSSYYSLQSRPVRLAHSRLRRLARVQHCRYAVSGTGVLGRMLQWRRPEPGLKALSLVRPDRQTRILDVGCGNGDLLYRMQEAGFQHLLGIDPFLQAPIEYENGLRIQNVFLDEVPGEWDIVMFHHSFEHMPDPLGALRSVKQVLSPGGACLIRVPTTSSWAWRHYRENWAQIDAPRHLFVPSAKTIEVMAEKTGFRVQQLVYDSNEFQFVASEMYMKDLPLHRPNSPTEVPFSKAEIKAFQRKAEKLNRERDGDQFACVLTT